MAERLTFTLAGRDELSRVMNGTADSADRLRLRMAGITADADGNLRDLQGRFLTLADAQRQVDDRAAQVHSRFNALSEASDKLGEKIKGSLISLAPAAIPAAAGLAASAAAVAAQFGSVALAAAAYKLALGPQITAIGDAISAQDAYEEAVRTSGATSQEAIAAQAKYQQALEKMPPATREAAVAVGLLKDNYQEWSDSLAGDVMAPFTKGIAVANGLLPKTTGLVQGASTQFDRLITMVGGAIATPGFDALTGKVTDFSERTLREGVDNLTIFLSKLQSGEYDNSELSQWMSWAQEQGPVVWDTLENVGDALLHVLEAGADVGVGMLDVVNVLSDIVSAVPPEGIAMLLQLAIAIKAVRLAAAGMDAARAAMAAIGTQITATATAAGAATTATGGFTAALGAMSKGAKLALAGTGLGLLLITLDSLSTSSQKPKPNIDQLSTSLIELGRSGKVSGEALRVYGSDLGALSDALDTIYNPSGFESFLQGWAEFIGMDSTGVKDAKEDIDGIDQALASLVSQGKADEAAAALDMTIKKLGLSGDAAKEFRSDLDGYSDALAGQALEQQLAAESMGLFGAQAADVQAELEAAKASTDGMRQSIQALNEVNRQSIDGMIGFEAAIDAASKAAQENAGVLDMQNGQLVLNTDEQRAAAQALTDLASKTDGATAAARDSGSSWEEVSSIYERGRAQLIKNAQQMGLNEQQARALADEILRAPDKTAFLKGDIEDLKKKLADAKERLKNAPSSKTASIRADISDLQRKIAVAKDALNNLDGYSATTWIYTNYSTPHHMSTGGLLHRASGGPIIPGFPGGGQIVGPGTATSDSVLLWGSNGEYVIRESSVRKYGVDFLEALNQGKLPVGRSAKPGMAAAPMSSSTAAAGGASHSVTYNVYPRQSVIGVEDLQLLQRQEEARQRVGRAR
ncbi:hypothetical protein ACIGMX_12485 [Streptomyces aquilus]|uniref:hypothetical protein n=1 Tax=Streptomyces aquilus TaxID=2548456 RepID=UPI0037CE751B